MSPELHVPEEAPAEPTLSQRYDVVCQLLAMSHQHEISLVGELERLDEWCQTHAAQLCGDERRNAQSDAVWDVIEEIRRRVAELPR